jgi:hypothetical protein
MAAVGYTYVNDEVAYEKGRNRNILANARKTFERTYEDSVQIVEWLDGFKVFLDNGKVTYPESFGGSLAQAWDTYGKLSEKQVAAVRKIIADRAARKAEWATKQVALNATREHVGVVGEKITLTITTKHIVEIATQFGVSAIFICEDDKQNTIIYKGTGAAVPSKGETATIVATVKEHGVREGVKQTVIQRPKLAK